MLGRRAIHNLYYFIVSEEQTGAWRIARFFERCVLAEILSATALDALIDPHLVRGRSITLQTESQRRRKPGCRNSERSDC